MNIFLIVIGALLFLFCGAMYLGTHHILKDQKTWEMFVKKGEERNMDIPEEYLYQLVTKMNFWFGAGTLLGLLATASGILLCTMH